MKVHHSSKVDEVQLAPNAVYFPRECGFSHSHQPLARTQTKPLWVIALVQRVDRPGSLGAGGLIIIRTRCNAFFFICLSNLADNKQTKRKTESELWLFPYETANTT
jgi:hypothetical protein